MFPHATTAIPAVKCLPGSLRPLRNPLWFLREEVNHLNFFPNSPETAFSFPFQIFLGSGKTTGNCPWRFSITSFKLPTCARFSAASLALEKCSAARHVNSRCLALNERMGSEDRTPSEYEFRPSSAIFSVCSSWANYFLQSLFELPPSLSDNNILFSICKDCTTAKKVCV